MGALCSASCHEHQPGKNCDAVAAVPGTHASPQVIVGNAPMRLGPYLSYADSNRDEMPLYMFDKVRGAPRKGASTLCWLCRCPASHIPQGCNGTATRLLLMALYAQAFALAAPQLARDYEVPAYFADDLFEALGEEDRPDYRWLIIGPKHSGSSFHVDPNATSAWNAGGLRGLQGGAAASQPQLRECVQRSVCACTLLAAAYGAACPPLHDPYSPPTHPLHDPYSPPYTPKSHPAPLPPLKSSRGPRSGSCSLQVRGVKCTTAGPGAGCTGVCAQSAPIVTGPSAPQLTKPPLFLGTPLCRCRMHSPRRARQVSRARGFHCSAGGPTAASGLVCARACRPACCVAEPVAACRAEYVALPLATRCYAAPMALMWQLRCRSWSECSGSAFERC